ncbi:MAG TPA: YihY/virulence factor BrkB family protein [Alphaproteobacteria bacterium]|nr:YihY/virulence factor BrkB family protein [Alphaproteobacteria bacterium]
MNSQPRASRSDAHGRRAQWPSDGPKRRWRDILFRVKDAVSQKNISLIAAGAAFYAFVAIPSGIAALVALYGLLFDPADVQRQVQGMRELMPADAVKLISDQLTYLTSHSHESLGIGFIVSLLVALWSVSSSTTSLMAALNVVYGEEEKRGLLRFYAVALALTVVVVLFAVVALALVAVLPAVLRVLPLGDFGKTLASILRWPILLVSVMIGLAVVFRFAPSRERPKWRWVTRGTVVAATLWIAASALFSLYVGEFASYDKRYGSLAGVIVLLMWLYFSFYAVLLGAELDAEIEHQAGRSGTKGSEPPIGIRGAEMADTVGKKH